MAGGCSAFDAHSPSPVDSMFDDIRIDLIRFQLITSMFQMVFNLIEIRIRFEPYVSRDDLACRKHVLKEDNIVLLMRQ